MGFLSRFDNKLSEVLTGGGIDEIDPEKSDLGKLGFLLNPGGTAGAAGYFGPFGTPTKKAVDSPYAVEGITDRAQDSGAETAALIALGSYFGGGGGGDWFGGGGGEAGGAGGAGFDPGGELYGVGGADGATVGGGGGGGSDQGLTLLADSGATTTDVTPGLLDTGSSQPAGGEFEGAYNPDVSSAGNALNDEPGWGASKSSQPTTTGDSSWTSQGKKYGVPLALLGASTVLSSRKQEMPNKAQYQELSAEAQAMAKLLIDQYKSGTLSAAQQAQLDQLTQQTKNQINNYYAGIGQAGSTSHQQALAKADMDALGVKANMLQTSLQQGLQALGVAQGPLNAMATYQMQNDKRLQDAYANFARSAGYLYGMNSAPAQQQPAPAA